MTLWHSDLKILSDKQTMFVFSAYLLENTDVAKNCYIDVRSIDKLLFL